MSLDYGRQDLLIFSVGENRQIGFEQAAVANGEPLKLQLDAFLDFCRNVENSRNVPALPRVKLWEPLWLFLIKSKSTRK